MTLTIAKNCCPARIVGLDIDGALIHAAKQNIRHYLSEVHTLQARKERNEVETSKKRGEDGEEKDKDAQPENVGEKDGSVEDGENKTDRIRESESSNGNRLFPVSLCVSRGPIAAPPLPDMPTLPPGNFPSNVTFVRVRAPSNTDQSYDITTREDICITFTHSSV